MEHFFETRTEAAVAAADRIVAALARRLESQSRTSLVVTGGSSPAQCYSALAESDLDWPNVEVLLSDERWVSPSDDDSNEKLVRETLLVGRAADARLLPLFAADVSPAERCDKLNETVADLELPFGCSLLGMGEDGHFASLFPDADNLDEGLQVDATTFFIPVTTTASPHPRISLTLSALTRSDEILLLFFGAAKRAVYEHAKDKSSALPVSKLLFQKRAPVHVFWAP